MAYQREEHKESTVETYAIPVRALHEVLGGTKLIAEINQGDIEHLVKTIERIQAFVSQRYPQMPLLKAIAAADRDGNTKRLAKKSVTKYFNGVHSIFNYAVDKGLLDSLPVRSKSLRKQLREKGGSSKWRELFKDSELKAIYNAPLYTGCVDDERWYAKPGLNRPKRARYWIPILALFHGARLQELCQLYCQDVKVENGVAYLSIRLDLDDDEAEDKVLKTESSVRDVPVHPELIRMGFLDFVKERRKDGAKARLFPEINLGKNQNAIAVSLAVGSLALRRKPADTNRKGFAILSVTISEQRCLRPTCHLNSLTNWVGGTSRSGACRAITFTPT